MEEKSFKLNAGLNDHNQKIKINIKVQFLSKLKPSSKTTPNSKSQLWNFSMEIFPRSVFHKSGFSFQIKISIYGLCTYVCMYVLYEGKKCSEPLYLLTVISIAFHCIISTLIVSPYFPIFFFLYFLFSLHSTKPI